MIYLVTEMMAPVFIASRIYFSVEMRGFPRILLYKSANFMTSHFSGFSC